MKLFVDIGNQRIKWQTSDRLTLPSARSTQVWSYEGRVTVDGFKQRFASLPVPESVWVSCVSSDDVVGCLCLACVDLWQIEPVQVKSTSKAAGVLNGYARSEQLGVDRWLALIAAHHLLGDNHCVVVDAGTAVTVDGLTASGEFVGGVIFPGMRTMQKSLNLQTEKITILSLDEQAKNIALCMRNNDTHSAVINGTELAVLSGIESAVRRFSEAFGDDVSILITGGDAKRIAGLTDLPMRLEPSLVMLGLSVLSSVEE